MQLHRRRRSRCSISGLHVEHSEAISTSCASFNLFALSPFIRLQRSSWLFRSVIQQRHLLLSILNPRASCRSKYQHSSCDSSFHITALSCKSVFLFLQRPYDFVYALAIFYLFSAVSHIPSGLLGSKMEGNVWLSTNKPNLLASSHGFSISTFLDFLGRTFPVVAQHTSENIFEATSYSYT